MKKLSAWGVSTSAVALSLVVLILATSPQHTAVAASKSATQTAQGLMINLNATGTFTLVQNRIYHFNVDEQSLVDANGAALPASAYFTNAWDGNAPKVTCTGSASACKNPAPTATPPSPDSDKVVGPSGQCESQKCTFLDGGTLAESSYVRSVSVTVGSGKTKRVYTYTYTYLIKPDATKDVDVNVPGVQVEPLTAWVFIRETGDSLAQITVMGDIAGESVIKSSKLGTKYSFSLRNADGTSRVTNLKFYLNGVLIATPNSTLLQNCSGCKAGMPGAVDFTHTTNAGTNGYTSLLKNGDARTILNTDTFLGNNDGGADGAALAKATTDPLVLNLPPGDYTLTLTGTVKGVEGLSDIAFSIKSVVRIIAPGCGTR